MDVTVCIGTFGAPAWPQLAKDRAIPSVPDGVPVVHEHGTTLANARNAAVAKVETEWVVHLDADDELADGYLDAMATGSADLRAPMLQRVRRNNNFGDPFMPQVWGHPHQCKAECLREGNWIVVGAAVRTELVRSVGGWEEFGWSEDWALWARCWKAGATVEPIVSAVYRGHWAPASRNRRGRAESVRWHREIEQAVWPDEASLL